MRVESRESRVESISTALLLALAIAGCDGSNDPEKPVVERFEAQPMIVDRGGDTKLVWTVRDAERIFVRTSTRTIAESAEAEGVAMARELFEDTLFTLEAMNAVGSSFATVRVAILRGPPPAIDRFTVDPETILLGEEATLSWETTNATELSISTAGGEVILARATEDGSLPVSPEETTTYVLTASSGGGTASAEVTLAVDDPRPEIVSFTATPPRIALGETSRLAWEVADAAEIVIAAGGSVLIEAEGSGTATVAPMLTTEYELAATNSYGTKIARATVEVDLPAVPAIVTFEATPNPIARGAGTVLEFNVDDADLIRIFEDDVEIDSRTITFGSLAVTPPARAETSYRLEAENDIGISTRTVIVYGHLPASIDSFALAPDELAASATITASWSLTSASKVELYANGALILDRVLSSTAALDLSESTPVFLEKTTFFELVATSAAGTARSRAIAVIGILESEPNNTRTQADPHPADGRDGAGTVSPGTDVDWYSIAVPANGNIRAETTDGTGQCAVDTVITVYAPNGSTVLAMDDDGGEGACSRIDPAQTAGLAAGTYYVVVSSKGGTGEYAVAIRARGPGCGNGLIEAAEACDDGNTDPADGCSATCTAEGTEEEEAIGNDSAMSPGVLAATTDETFFGSISPIGDVDFFAVTMPDGYNLEAYLTVGSLTDCPSNPRGALALIAPNATTQLATNDSGGPSGNCGRIAIDTTNAALQMPGGTYFLRVREAGDDAEIATYFLHVRIVPAGCGNGLVEPGEACDDGDQTSNDGCDASCQWEIGPAISPPGGMAVVSLTEVGGASIVRVNITINGQSIGAVAADPGAMACSTVDTALELYDDEFALLGAKSGGGPSGSAGTCARLIPGMDAFSTDLAVGAHYLFVRSEGGTGNASLSVTVVNPACGNGIREARANEHCDDGNLAGGDGCSSACLLEGSSGVEMEPNGSQAAANPTALVGIGTYTVVGANNPAGDDDVFSFVVPAGPQLRFSARTYSMIGAPNACDSNLTDTRLLLERTGVQTSGPGTGELAYNDDRDSANNVWCSEISNVRLGSGTYYLRVQGWNDTQVTSYLVDFTLTP